MQDPITAMEQSLEASITTVSQEIIDRKASIELNNMLLQVDAAIAEQNELANASRAAPMQQGKIIVNTTQRVDEFSGRRCIGPFHPEAFRSFISAQR